MQQQRQLGGASGRYGFVSAVDSKSRGVAVDNIWMRIAENMAARVSGPMKLRLLLQPAMAAFFAIRSGLLDARSGKPPYFWSLATDPTQRADLIKDGWKSVGKVFILALVLDVVFQLIELHFVYPGEAVAVAFILAIAPYLVLRGLVTRLMSRK
jgi:hypothetical protein